MITHSSRTIGSRGRLWLDERDRARLDVLDGQCGYGAILDVGVCVHDDANPTPDVGEIGRVGRYATARVRVVTDGAITIPIEVRGVLDLDVGDEMLFSARCVRRPLSER